MSAVSGPQKRKFWTVVNIRPTEGGFALYLDERPLKTPAKSSLIVPCNALAEAIAAEWMAQKETIVPATMPMTRRANAAIDKVTPQLAEVAAMLAAYGETDLVCYRATHPSELMDRQAAAWDPVLAWVAREFGAKLSTTNGVVPVTQDAVSVRKIGDPIRAMDAFTLTGFHDLVTISGSVVIALAVIHRAFSDEDLWDRATVDENWQAEQWGIDIEAAAQTESAKRDFLDGLRFFRLVS